MSGYLDWFDAYCLVCKIDTPHGRDDPCREDEEAVVWCLVCEKTTSDDEYKIGVTSSENIKDPQLIGSLLVSQKITIYMFDLEAITNAVGLLYILL